MTTSLLTDLSGTDAARHIGTGGTRTGRCLAQPSPKALASFISKRRRFGSAVSASSKRQALKFLSIAHHLLQVVLARADVELGLHDTVTTLQNIGLYAKLAASMFAPFVERQFVQALLPVNLRQKEMSDVGHLLKFSLVGSANQFLGLPSSRLNIPCRKIELRRDPVTEEVGHLCLAAWPGLVLSGIECFARGIEIAAPAEEESLRATPEPLQYAPDTGQSRKGGALIEQRSAELEALLQ